MDISPIILRRHPELSRQQREVIGHTGGPLRVIAGPGAGKTLSIHLRAVNLLLTAQTAPEDLVLCTFGRDAAGELQRRFTESAGAYGVSGDLSGLRISTIHSLCHRLLAPHAELVGLRDDYRVLDEQEQHLLLHQESGAIFGPDWDILSGRGWRDGIHTVAEAARYFDRICDERIDPAVLAASCRPFIAALGRCCLRYRELLQERGAADFGHLQVWADLVLEDGEIAAEAGEAVRHLMVDEFQDTSRIQLRILSRLSETHGNIVVVGDDDQSIYRFRGASVSNLLEFPRWFPGCRTVELATNYRSHRDIVAAVGRWMDTSADWDNEGRPLRYAKEIVAAAPETHADYPAVIAVEGTGPVDEGRRVGGMLRFLRSSGVIAGYGQAALLLHSVKDAVSGPYLDGLEQAGVGARCEPAGHVGTHAGDELLVTTIHQAKGREWDVVVVGSLGGPDLETDRVGRNLAEYCGTDADEPVERIGDLDRARRHYVAFTRARHLLALTASGEPQARFRSLWEGAARWPWVDRESLARQRFGVAEAAPQRVVEIDRLDRLVVRLMKSGLALSMAPGGWAGVRKEVQSPLEAALKKTPETATARSSAGLTGS